MRFITKPSIFYTSFSIIFNIKRELYNIQWIKITANGLLL